MPTSLDIPACRCSVSTDGGYAPDTSKYREYFLGHNKHYLTNYYLTAGNFTLWLSLSKTPKTEIKT